MMSSPRSSGLTAFHLQASSKKGRMYIYNSIRVLSKEVVVQGMLLLMRQVQKLSVLDYILVQGLQIMNVKQLHYKNC